MTFRYGRNLDMKCSKKKLSVFNYFFIYILFLNTAGGPRKSNIYSKNVFSVLNIIDYSLYFRVYFQH